MKAFAADINQFVESLYNGPNGSSGNDEGGWTATNSVATSKHLGGSTGLRSAVMGADDIAQGLAQLPGPAQIGRGDRRVPGADFMLGQPSSEGGRRIERLLAPVEVERVDEVDHALEAVRWACNRHRQVVGY